MDAFPLCCLMRIVSWELLTECGCPFPDHLFRFFFLVVQVVFFFGCSKSRDAAIIDCYLTQLRRIDSNADKARKTNERERMARDVGGGVTNRISVYATLCVISFHLIAHRWFPTFSPATSEVRNGHRAVSVTLTRHRSRSISLMPP